jgi:hypothetical protein
MTLLHMKSVLSFRQSGSVVDGGRNILYIVMIEHNWHEFWS